MKTISNFYGGDYSRNIVYIFLFFCFLSLLHISLKIDQEEKRGLIERSRLLFKAQTEKKELSERWEKELENGASMCYQISVPKGAKIIDNVLFNPPVIETHENGKVMSIEMINLKEDRKLMFNGRKNISYLIEDCNQERQPFMAAKFGKVGLIVNNTGINNKLVQNIRTGIPLSLKLYLPSLADEATEISKMKIHFQGDFGVQFEHIALN